MQGKGSAHIFVYYQKPGRYMPETGEWEETKNAQKEFVVSEGMFKSYILIKMPAFCSF